MKSTRRKYYEPVFYFNPDGNCFLIAEYISKNSIFLHVDSQIPKENGKIEFSFPDSKYVVCCKYELEIEDQQTILNLKELSTMDQKIISDFLGEQKDTNHRSRKSEASL